MVLMHAEDVYAQHLQKQKIRWSSYEAVLQRVHLRIQSSAAVNRYSCSFDIPPFLLGMPAIDVDLCRAFLQNQLQRKGYTVRVTSPRRLLIAWGRWSDEDSDTEDEPETVTHWSSWVMGAVFAYLCYRASQSHMAGAQRIG